MDNWKITLKIDMIVSAKTKEEAITKGIDSASQQFFTEFSQDDFVKAKKIKGHYNMLGVFVGD